MNQTRKKMSSRRAESNRRSIWLPPEPRDEPRGSLYADMFMQDCVNRVLPWKTRDGETEVVTFTPHDLRVEDVVAGGLGRDRSLTSALREFARMSLQMAMLDRRAAFELAYETEEGTRSSTVGFALLPIWDGELIYRDR